MKEKGGFFFVDKPEGLSSFGVCKSIRRQLGVKKVGHAGTLDPFATGLLLVAVGRATRFLSFLSAQKKAYQTTILLGKTSETLDNTVPLRDCWNGHKPSLAEIRATLDEHFQGRITQKPPAFSAIKVKGIPAYKKARAGESFNLPPRETTIYRVAVLDYDFPYLRLFLEVASGFYVRSFARDLGERLTGGALCTELRRVSIGAHHMAEKSLLPLEGKVEYEDFCYAPFSVLPFEPLIVPEVRAKDFQQGRAIFIREKALSPHQYYTILTAQGDFLGVGQYLQGNIQPKRVW